jgi:hypothetical protein
MSLENIKFSKQVIINFLISLIGNLLVYWPIKYALYSMIDMPFGGIFVVIWLFIFIINITLLILSALAVYRYYFENKRKSKLTVIFIFNLIPIVTTIFLLIATN